MLSDFTIGALGFAAFCVGVDVALVNLKNRELILREEIHESIMAEIKNQLPDKLNGKHSNNDWRIDYQCDSIHTLVGVIW